MKSINYIIEYFLNEARYRNKLSLPQNINFPITDNCNSQCVMCDVWKEKSDKDLTVSEIKTIFNNRLFRKVKHIGLSGGEPSLRNDLVEIVDTLLECLPTLVTLSITSHGYHTEIWTKLLPLIKQNCELKGVTFQLNISIDGSKKVHNLNRGIKTAFDKASATIEVVKKYNTKLQLQHTVTPINFNNINSSFATLQSLNDDFVMRRSVEIARLDNKNTISKLGDFQRLNSVFSDFILNSDLLKVTKNPARRLFYKELADRLANGGNRMAPCYYQNEGLVVTATGDLYHCSISYDKIGNALENDASELYFSERSLFLREKLLANTCKSCLHDQSGAWSPNKLIWETFSFYTLSYITKIKKISVLISKFSKLLYSELLFTQKQIALKQEYKQCFIIGAYGGEHVGDSAILGGVIERINFQFNVEKFTIFSFRTDRTKIWLEGLNFSPKLDINIIDKNEYSDVFENINANEALLVYAGGPIMELFEDLATNTVLINKFLKKSIPFVIEGCGYGPFNNRIGYFLGSNILKKASQVTLRQKINTSISYKLNHDPAFDYISNHLIDFKDSSTELTTLKIKYKKIVIINLRPLWEKYAQNVDLVESSNRILNELKQLIENNKDKYFIFLPFNFDHFGFSDIIPALDLIKLLDHDDRNFELVEKELNFREVMPYLLIADFAICMRFHACIFAASSGVRTMGIDYSGNGQGKVYTLFEQGKIESILNLNNFNQIDANNFINS